ncbi:MAG: 3-deoxy-7-phosphoheptulonate synthase [bacterium]|nr:3-deoxy-7-phosphoheptulonate synthase [bacterium]
MSAVQPQKSKTLALRQPNQNDTLVRINDDVCFGGSKVVLIGGPCAVESLQQISDTAKAVKSAGGVMLRGGAWKPRTSPYDFQGLKEEGLELLHQVKKITGLPVVTEVLDPRDVEKVSAVADMLQIGSRSVQNYPLLKEVGQTRKPILLKRGMMTTVDEWLAAAEYILAEGNDQVVLCERGIRTFETSLRNTLDVGAVAVLKDKTHLPIIVDPSHAAGNFRYVNALARAAVAAGADGLLVETHWRPADALSDASQSLTPEQFRQLADQCRAVAIAVERTL